MNKESTTIIAKQSNPIITRAETLTIAGPEDMNKAAALLTELNTIIDKADEAKNQVLKPLNAARAAELKRWQPITKPLEAAVSVLRAKMSEYQTQAKKAADAQAAAIAARVSSGSLKIETGIRKLDEVEKPEQIVNVGEHASVAFRTLRQLKITDPALIPRQYLVPDENAMLVALKAGATIPGAEIEEVQVPANYR